MRKYLQPLIIFLVVTITLFGGLYLYNSANKGKVVPSPSPTEIASGEEIAGGITRVVIGAQTKWLTDLVPSTSFSVDLGSATNNVNHIYASGNFDFDGELLPDGATCSNGQILKKTGANDWDCAADAGGSVTSNSLDFDEFVNSMTVDATLTITGGLYSITFDHASISGLFEVEGVANFEKDVVIDGTDSGIYFNNDMDPVVQHYYSYLYSEASSSFFLQQSSDVVSAKNAILSYSGLSADRTYTFPNATGTFILSSGSVPFETSGYASASLFQGSAFSIAGNECSDDGDTLAWNAGVFTCGDDDNSGGAGGGITGIEVAERGVFQDVSVASLSFDPGAFAVSASGTQQVFVQLDYGANGPASLSQAETITGNWVNTANPWADNEVVDTITASNYLLLTGGTLTGNLIGTNASFSTGEFTTYASASAYKGSAFSGDCDAAGDTLNWDVTTGRFTCGTDASGGSVASDSLGFGAFINELTLDKNVIIASAGFNWNWGLTNFTAIRNASISKIFEIGCTTCYGSSVLKIDARTGDLTSDFRDIFLTSNGVNVFQSSTSAGLGDTLLRPNQSLGRVLIGDRAGADYMGIFDGNASLITFETASVSINNGLRGSGLTDCDTAATSKLLWDATQGRFSCGTDQNTGGVASDSLGFGALVNPLTLDTNVTIASVGFSLNFSTGGLQMYGYNVAYASRSSPFDITVYKDGSNFVAYNNNTTTTISKGTSATTVVQAAFTNVPASGSINIKNGVYALGATGLTMSSSLAPGVSIIGESKGGVKFTYSGSGHALTIGDTSGDTRKFRMENIIVEGGSSGLSGIKFSRVKNSLFKSLVSRGFSHNTNPGRGFNLDGTGSYTGDNDFYDLLCDTSEVCIATFGGANSNHFFGFALRPDSTGEAVRVQGANGNTFQGGLVGNASAGFKFTSTGDENAVSSTYCEDNTRCVVFLSGSQNNDVEVIDVETNDVLYTDEGTGNSIRFVGVDRGSFFKFGGNASISSNFEVSGFASASAYYLTDSATGASFADCDGDTQALGWDTTTKRFFCGDDDSAAVASNSIGFGAFINPLVLDTNITVTSAAFAWNWDGTNMTEIGYASISYSLEIGGFSAAGTIPKDVMIRGNDTTGNGLYITDFSELQGILINGTDIAAYTADANGNRTAVGSALNLEAGTAGSINIGIDGADEITVGDASANLVFFGYMALTGRASISSNLDIAGLLGIPAAASKTLTKTGQTYFDTTDTTLVVHDGTAARVVGDDIQQFTFTIYDDGSWASESIPIWQAPKDYAVTVVQTDVTVTGSAGASMSYNFQERAYGSINVTGSDVFSPDETVTVSGDENTSFSDSSLAAKSHLLFRVPVGVGDGNDTVYLVTGVIYYRRNVE